MEIDVSIHQATEPIAIMQVKGEINATNFILLTDKIALLYSGVPQNVQQDANPDFTHSSNARKHVKLLNPQPEVDKSIENAGMKQFFKVFTDLDSAIASFK